MLIVIALIGRSHAAVAQILGSPLIAVVMLLFIINTAYHMWIGMQEIIFDYVHDEKLKLVEPDGQYLLRLRRRLRRQLRHPETLVRSLTPWPRTDKDNGGAPKVNGRAYPIEDHPTTSW